MNSNTFPPVDPSRRAMLAAGASLAALGAAGPAFAQSSGTFKMGAVLCKTGPYSQIGAFIEPALIVGVQEVNAAGGILGRKVELVVRDDASAANRAVLAAKELISVQNVDLMFPEFVSPLVMAILPITTEAKVITLTSGSAPQIADVEKFPYSFQYGDNANLRVPPFISAMKKLGGKRVGILMSTNTSSIALGELLAADIPRSGMEVAAIKNFAVDAKDLSAQLQSLRDAGADIIAFQGPARDNNRVVMQSLATIGWKAKLVTEHSSIATDLPAQFPPSTYDQFFAVTYRSAVSGGGQKPSLQRFIANFNKIAPMEALAISACARDLVLLAKWGIETAQTKLKSTSGDAVKRTLESIGDARFPDDYFLTIGNPNFTAKAHNCTGADFSKVWGLAHVSKAVNGIYTGEPLDI